MARTPHQLAATTAKLLSEARSKASAFPPPHNPMANPHTAELHAKAPGHGFEKSAGNDMFHLKKPGKTVTVQSHSAGAKVVVHRPAVGDVAIPSVSHQHPSVDAALAHAKKLHSED